MNQQYRPRDEYRIGDKVRLKLPEYAGKRGIITGFTDEQFVVDMGGSERVTVRQAEFTNFSLAARLAWKKMPKQAGRPRRTSGQKKMVSIRIEAANWELLGKAVERGYVPSREVAVNSWIQEKLSQFALLQTENEHTRPAEGASNGKTSDN